jgi:GntR family transcriptional regulator, transcriptional repressor for pyruvate dehydrogenase complex
VTQREVEIARSTPRPLKTRSVAEAVASQLRSRILDGDLTDGSELPTESVLLEEFPVSRPSLREAFRILEAEGLLRVRRGKRGGTVITHPTPDTAAYHVGLLLHARGTSLEDLAIARNLLEPLCAEQAAMRPDHVSVGRKLAELSAVDKAQVANGFTFTAVAIRFHQELVMAAGNRTLETLAGILESMWNAQELTWAQSAVNEGGYPAVNLRHEVLKAHLRISQAIEAGDVSQAVHLTRGHLKAASPFVASHGGQVRILDEDGGRRQVRNV